MHTANQQKASAQSPLSPREENLRLLTKQYLPARPTHVLAERNILHYIAKNGDTSKAIAERLQGSSIPKIS